MDPFISSMTFNNWKTTYFISINLHPRPKKCFNTERDTILYVNWTHSMLIYLLNKIISHLLLCSCCPFWKVITPSYIHGNHLITQLGSGNPRINIWKYSNNMLKPPLMMLVSLLHNTILNLGNRISSKLVKPSTAYKKVSSLIKSIHVNGTFKKLNA